jgi:hypothetical protein
VLLGAIGAEQTLFSIIGPAVWPPIWALTESSSPALSFYIATALAAGGIAACMALPRLELVEEKASAKALEKLSLQGATGALSTPRGSSATIDDPSFDYQYLRSRRLSNTTGHQQRSGELARPLLGSGASRDQYDGKTRPATDSATLPHVERLPASTAISDYRREAMLVRAVSTHVSACQLSSMIIEFELHQRT